MSKGDAGFTREISNARGLWRGLAGHRANAPSHTSATRRHCVEGAGGTGGPGCGGRGRRRGLAGLRDDAPSGARCADGSRAGRRPPAHTAAGPHKAARPHSRGLRHPEHQQHHVVEMGGIEPPSQRGARNTSGATSNARAPARHSKRGRHQPTPCASALTHP